MLEERKAEVVRDLDQAYSGKQVQLSVYSQKAQDTVEKILQVTDFVERSMKHSSHGEALLLKKPLDDRLHELATHIPELNLASITELEFISNFQAIQVGVKNQFGYIRSKPEHGPGRQQPPISRPGPAPLMPPQPSHLPHPHHQGHEQSFTQSPMMQYMEHPQQRTSCHSLYSAPSQPSSHLEHGGSLSTGNLLAKRFNSGDSGIGGHTGLGPAPGFSSASQLSSLLSGSSIADLASSSGLSNPYEKWSNGSDSLFGNLPGPRASSPQGFKDRLGLSQQNSTDSLLDLSSKFMTQACLQSPPMPPGTPIANGSVNSSLYPLKSQIKRQKMIYHCKFGEFGILEGQFTEPSGVAVNAQNDIIVADTNNHRIQIFDKEGRFKFQFGEVGKRDGQLLYPNRVAVVKTSGDIIVTERSPTHQIQIYNQYGQFVRKFGANILQHPRGVCVDNKGRIIVVECKVMRVIIFDQMGNVLNKFGCSKHLEFPNGVVVNDRQEIFISDNRAHCVKVFDYDGNFLRQIGGEGITNYPIGVGINAAGEITIADNHNNFNLSVFSQDGQLISALESKVKHAQCFDVSLMDDGSVVLASKDYRLYIYRYIQVPPLGL